MKQLKISKNVEDYCLVAKRGDKYIRCSGKLKPVGVFKLGHTKKWAMITNKGYKHFSMNLPTGIFTYGEVDVKVRKEK